MKKQDLTIVLLLFAFMLAWPMVYKRFFHSEPPKQVTPEEPAQESVPLHPSSETSLRTPSEPALKPEADLFIVPSEPVITPLKKTIVKTAKPEQTISITNAFITATFSSRGGGLISAELKQYRETVDIESGPVMLDFSDLPALVYFDLPGLSATDDFEIKSDESGSVIHIEKVNPEGLRLTRTISLGENYRFDVMDILKNEGSQPFSLPDHLIQIGPMQKVGTQSKIRGQSYLGIDALLSSSGEGVKHWDTKLPKWFKAIRKNKRLLRLPEAITVTTNTPIDWVAVKSKFFVQILASDGGGAGYIMHAERKLLPGEQTDPNINPKNAEIDSVSASMIFPELVLNPDESIAREISYYIGPKKYSILKHLGLYQAEVMNFGMWKPVCKILLSVLNATYSIIPNYGVAILLLTILIRIIFWPLTHKSTESMKRMQELQPQMTEIRNKFKGNAKKIQEETMALYKKNKVNPMSGCLPMIIQIPVFIALFVVLRSAIELRFAPFLWISDLSEPERLLANVLPIPLNILPIFMTVTMVWQQKLMPTSAADPNQQKIMMMFMPIMMLVLFYNMPSALVLYWSASQCLMIVQQLIQKKRSAMKAAQV